jgi:hypothetical protein
MLWIPTQARRSTLDMCSFGLLSLATPWNDVALGTSIALIVSYILIASILTTQLFRTPGVDPMGRIAASQMVYYLAIAAIIFVSAQIFTSSNTKLTIVDTVPAFLGEIHPGHTQGDNLYDGHDVT